MLCGDLTGKEIQKWRDMCVYEADSLCRTAEINTSESNYTPRKITQQNNRKQHYKLTGGARVKLYFLLKKTFMIGCRWLQHTVKFTYGIKKEL